MDIGRTKAPQFKDVFVFFELGKNIEFIKILNPVLYMVNMKMMAHVFLKRT